MSEEDLETLKEYAAWQILNARPFYLDRFTRFDALSLFFSVVSHVSDFLQQTPTLLDIDVVELTIGSLHEQEGARFWATYAPPVVVRAIHVLLPHFRLSCGDAQVGGPAGYRWWIEKQGEMYRQDPQAFAQWSNEQLLVALMGLRLAPPPWKQQTQRPSAPAGPLSFEESVEEIEADLARENAAKKSPIARPKTCPSCGKRWPAGEWKCRACRTLLK